jgi:hypothetical protein
MQKLTGAPVVKPVAVSGSVVAPLQVIPTLVEGTIKAARLTCALLPPSGSGQINRTEMPAPDLSSPPTVSQILGMMNAPPNGALCIRLRA